MYITAKKEGITLEPFNKLNGKTCPYVIPTSRTAKSLMGFSLIYKDLLYAGQMIKKSSETESDGNELIKQALFFSGITLYAKSFTKADGRKIWLNYKDVFKDNNSNKETHLELMEIRHQYIAHGGVSKYEPIVVKVNLNPDVNDKRILDIDAFCYSMVFSDTEYCEKYLKVIDIAMKYVNSKMDKKSKKVMDEVSEVPIEYLYQISRNADDDTG